MNYSHMEPTAVEPEVDTKDMYGSLRSSSKNPLAVIEPDQFPSDFTDQPSGTLTTTNAKTKSRKKIIDFNRGSAEKKLQAARKTIRGGEKRTYQATTNLSNRIQNFLNRNLVKSNSIKQNMSYVKTRSLKKMDIFS